MTGNGLCASCFEPKTFDWEWPESVPRPENVPDGPICGDCYRSLIRYVEISSPSGTETPGGNPFAMIQHFQSKL